MTLKEIRNDIDQIDSQLLQLFKERMDLALKVADIKKAEGLPVVNAQREKEILHKISNTVEEPLEGYGRILFHTLFDLSRSYQNVHLAKVSNLQERINDALENTQKLFPKKAVVACQGVAGSYSQAACEKLFQVPSTMFFSRFDDVFNAVEKGLCQYGILPIENSSYGSVGTVYDSMKNYDFHIVKSIRLRVSHSLLAKPNTRFEDVKEIYSHEQALGQCSGFLDTLKDVKITVCENTAMAAKIVADSSRNDIAAICSRDCAEIYGLESLNNNIQGSDNNYTRFICISKNLEIYPGADRISLMLSLPHKPGALYHMIAKFSALGVNLTKLESRPIPGSDFEFMFYFDMEASVHSPELVGLLSQLEQQPEEFLFLGNYTEML